MTEREEKSMVAMKRMYDAYYELPLSVRAAIDGKLDNEMGLIKSALKLYKSEVRESLNNAAVKVANHRWGIEPPNY